MNARELAGRCAIVTGASRGLGLAIGRAYVEAGASVLLAARGAGALDEARAELAGRAEAGQTVLARAADVRDPGSVAGLVGEAIRAWGRVDVLVNNAGVYGPKGPFEDTPWEEWQEALETNLYGTLLPCREVLPHMKRARRGKIVNLSGGGATAPLPFFSCYAASKAAVVRFTETLAHEVAACGIDVNAIAPGALNTRFLDEVLAAGPSRVGETFYAASLKQQEEGGTPLELGAALAVFLGSKASDGVTGRLLSAKWDPWRALAARREALAKSDVYTLRRIVPKDRGLDWETP